MIGRRLTSAVLQGKYTKCRAGYGGLKSWSSGKLRREEVAIRLEEKTVTNGNN